MSIESRSHSLHQKAIRPKFELAEILRRYLPQYIERHQLSLWQKHILYKIQICRTAAMGGHLEECDHCHYQQPAYNSCHNRHCPKCLGIARRRWVAARLNEILPVPYYHVVFTLPHCLNPLALYNKSLICGLFYQAAAYTLLAFGHDPKYLGAQLGFFAVLHTWGKGLCYHIHWHFIVPGGGLTPGGSWQPLPYSEEFLFPPKAMAKVICGRFIKLLREANDQGKLHIPEACEEFKDAVMFEYFLNDLACESWFNYVKSPFGGPKQVVKYIGRYTHRVALSNSRIQDIDDGIIRLLAKDYKHGGRSEEITLEAEEFIRRYLLHILPKRFRKIRYGGFLSNAVREHKLEQARRALGVEVVPEPPVEEPSQAVEQECTEKEDFGLCPQCHIGRMRIFPLPELSSIPHTHPADSS